MRHFSLSRGFHSKAIMERTAQASRLSPCLQQEASDTPKIGHIYGLGVIGSWGSTIEIEAAAFPAAAPGKGSLRFNDTAGSMAKDSVTASAAVVRQLTDKRLSDYDLHINVIGGGNIDGPSAGCAITCAILSAIEKKPLRQDIAITGEIALSGEVKPVGGIHEKAFGARRSGMRAMILPEKNKSDIDAGTAGIEIHPVSNIQEVWSLVTSD